MIDRLGLGVMLQMLKGDEDSALVIQKAIGKIITGLYFKQYEDDPDADKANLQFEFDDGNKIQIFDDGQSCCERRYMHTDDNLQDFIGAELCGVELRDGSSGDEDWGVQESQFLIVHTNIGDFTVVNYNEHNGYYGGFWIVAKDVKDD